MEIEIEIFLWLLLWLDVRLSANTDSLFAVAFLTPRLSASPHCTM